MDRKSVSAEPSELPVQLLARTPRKVRMTWVGWANVFLATFFLGIGVIFGVSIVKKLIRDVSRQDVLRQSGRESSGQVTGMVAATRWSGRYVSYIFAVNGTFYTGRSTVPREIWNHLRQNDSLPIRYFPADPNVSHPTDWEDPTLSILWLLVFPAGMAIVGVQLVRRIPLQRHLAVEGIAVRGCITDWHGPSRAKFKLDYTFRNADNDNVEIGSCTSDHSRAIGSDVWVLYLPGSSRRSEIYPFEGDFFRIDQ